MQIRFCFVLLIFANMLKINKEAASTWRKSCMLCEQMGNSTKNCLFTPLGLIQEVVTHATAHI